MEEYYLFRTQQPIQAKQPMRLTILLGEPTLRQLAGWGPIPAMLELV
jgi:hypothetical protein